MVRAFSWGGVSLCQARLCLILLITRDKNPQTREGMYHLKLPERLNQLLVTRSANTSLVGAEVLQGAAGPICKQISKRLAATSAVSHRVATQASARTFQARQEHLTKGFTAALTARPSTVSRDS
ncbi:platelet glycoprotein IX isoform X2 [Homo sapiens]|uniref:platelet glycoprotein IX isoform X2 n=1 Tax=Homo sapiens TaxID=9606 RepID=UPI001FB15240|nr:platelet glycoprotein IX isoform X2 [Homo sapiens]